MVVIWGLLFILPTTEQQATSPGAQTPQRVTPGTTLVTRPSDAPTSSNAPRPPDAEQENTRELTHRIQKLELEMIQKSGKSTADNTSIAIITAGIAATAVLGAALLGIFGQYFMARREDRRSIAAAQQALELAKQEAVFRQTGTILEFRLKQMEQFYAPMFALLGQSKGLYDKMMQQLIQDQPQRYRKVSNPGPRDYRFEVLDKHGQWQGFRLLDQLPAIRSDPKALALIDRILEIGEQMTKIISKHAGLASEDSMDLLGQYMAHYAILSTIHKLNETEPYEPGWHKMGYYPFDLNAKIEEGYRELSGFIDEYVAASKHMLQNLPGQDRRQQS
jgi:hypothetical protein